MSHVTAAPVRGSLDRLLRARSVAILGVSERPGALGNQVLANLEHHGFAGDIHLINPKHDTLAGRPCLRSVDDLPFGVDAAVLAIPGGAVIDTVRALATRDVGAAVIFAAGFAEGGEAGLAAQAELARIAAETGMVIEGPNCLGMTNYVDGIALTFVETPAGRLGDRPGVGIVSQSGAMAVVLGTTLHAKGLGISLSISTGNEAASGVEDYVDYLLDDPDTHVIAMIVEQFRSPLRFLALAARARDAGKPIVLLHPGRSSAAAASAATHTGAMAGDWHVMKTLVRHAGVVLVEGLEELGDVVDLSIRCATFTHAGVAVLTESGAFKALALDLCDAIALPLPEPSAETAGALRAAIPDFIPVSNPMDLTAQALVDPDLYRRTLTPLLADDRYGAIVFGIIQTDVATARLKFEPIIAAIEALAPQKPVIFAGLDEGAPVPAAYIDRLRALGVAYFPSPDRAFRAIAHLAHASGDDSGASNPVTIDLPSVAGVIPEYRVKHLLAAAGIGFPDGALATTTDEAVDIATRIGYPVVLKAQAAALNHKSEAGGVALKLANDALVRAAWAQMIDDVAAYDAAITLDGVLVEKMGASGVELIVGATRDKDWGPVLLVGIGGVTAELMRDVRLLPADLSVGRIEEELLALKGAALLTGFRGSARVDIAAVATLVAQLGAMMRGNPRVAEVDLNPVLVHPDGHGITVLDALMRID